VQFSAKGRTNFISLFLFNNKTISLNNIATLFSIKDLENLSGLKAHTIRIWEKRYNMLQPSRTDSNIRFYNLANLQKLLNVALLYEHGGNRSFPNGHLRIRHDRVRIDFQSVSQAVTRRAHSEGAIERKTLGRKLGVTLSTAKPRRAERTRRLPLDIDHHFAFSFA
jgi:hypothetical protein